MEVHKYTTANYHSNLDIVSGELGPNIRLFMPGLGVLGYSPSGTGQVHFFSDSPKIMEEAQRIISGACKMGEEYLGAVEVSKNLLEELADSGRDYNRISNRFNKSAMDVLNQVESAKKSTFII